MNPYRELFQAMNDANIHYLVVGGVAVNLHGYSRFTGDVDIVMALDVQNLEKISTLMAQRGFAQRLPIDVRQLSDRQKLKQWVAEKNLTAYTFIAERMPQFSLDIIVDESMRFDTFERQKVMIDIGELQIPVVSINDLIGMKKRANRQKDAEDVAALLELQGL